MTKFRDPDLARAFVANEEIRLSREIPSFVKDRTPDLVEFRAIQL